MLGDLQRGTLLLGQHGGRGLDQFVLVGDLLWEDDGQSALAEVFRWLRSLNKALSQQ